LELQSAKQNITEAVKLKAVKPKKQRVRATVACNACRADTHHKCEGFPCSQCVKDKIECIKEEHKVTSGAFKKGENSGEKNAHCKFSDAIKKEFYDKAHSPAYDVYGGLKKLCQEYDMGYPTAQKIKEGKYL